MGHPTTQTKEIFNDHCDKCKCSPEKYKQMEKIIASEQARVHFWKLQIESKNLIISQLALKGAVK